MSGARVARWSCGWILIGMLLGCTSKNEHFCAKYSYFHDQLSGPGLLPYAEIEAQLRAELNDPARDPDRARIGLFVLRDIRQQVKPEGESAQDYCLRRRLWERYP